MTTGLKATTITTTASNGVKVDVKVNAAQSKDKNLAGTYKVIASVLNLRAGVGTGKTILAKMPNGSVNVYDENGNPAGTVDAATVAEMGSIIKRLFPNAYRKGISFYNLVLEENWMEIRYAMHLMS